MLRIVAHGIREAYELLTGIAARAHDASPAWEFVANDVFAFEKGWWELTYGGRTDKDHRAGRDPQLMRETGALERSATVRGAAGQVVDVGPDYVFVGVTSGLAVIHEGLGRPVLGVPGPRSVERMVERVGRYILTGRANA